MALLLFGVSACASPSPQELSFRAVIGAESFRCGASYPGVGANATTIWPIDLRFYVHDVELRDAGGHYVAMNLDNAPPYQSGGVAMVDFEDASANCETGTTTTNDRITGSLPPGTYRGLRFKVGVPERLNHINGDEATDPLNNTGVGAGMQWAWLSGYKFFKLDLARSDKKDSDYVLHLGSTSCSRDGDTISCRQPNRPVIELAEFDPSTDVVVLDIAALLQEAALESNTEARGCHSANAEAGCLTTMPQLGLDAGVDDEGIASVRGKSPQVVFTANPQ